ncbi:MAG: ATP phosphoribosyltransferase [Bacteroidales bacterium]|nr:ATP phosphoribosyltransferase [Bacteroidales bacterium]
MEEKLKIAVQKSGRLHDGSISLLRECGIRIDNGFDQLIAPAFDFPADVLFLRNSDIPQYLEDGVADIAILGENVVIEKEKECEVVEKLGFSRCRLSLAIPRNEKYDGPGWFKNKKLATSYPNTLRKYLMNNNIDAEIHEISGSVEIAPNIGLADGICDLVSSGSTLFKNGLKEVEVILKSEACFVKGPALNKAKQAVAGEILFRIRSVLASRNNKYILLNAPDEKLEDICKILPGMKSPTIMPLALKGWSSVHSVISETDFWAVIGQLKEKGAQGILVIPIEKMVV